MADRAAAAEAAQRLRHALDEPHSSGEPTRIHIKGHRSVSGWLLSWERLPGFLYHLTAEGPSYTHALLPGWSYTADELRAEMIPDLVALAERGVRPTSPTVPVPRRRPAPPAGQGTLFHEDP